MSGALENAASGRGLGLGIRTAVLCLSKMDKASREHLGDNFRVVRTFRPGTRNLTFIPSRGAGRETKMSNILIVTGDWRFLTRSECVAYLGHIIREKVSQL